MLQRPRRPHLKRRVSAGLNQSSANGSRRPRECRLPKASRSQHSRNLGSSNQQVRVRASLHRCSVCAHSSAHSFHLLSLRLHICSHSKSSALTRRCSLISSALTMSSAFTSALTQIICTHSSAHSYSLLSLVLVCVGLNQSLVAKCGALAQRMSGLYYCSVHLEKMAPCCCGHK